MTILLTNDDGYFSKGIIELQKYLKNHLGKMLRQEVKIIIVAPMNEKSSCGHGLSITSPLKLIQKESDIYALDDGSPSDCVYVAINSKLCSPNLIISGINIGSNIGEDTVYSGTVGGAMEGALRGIPSIAISQLINRKYEGRISYNFDVACEFVCNIAAKILKNTPNVFKERKFLNINIPDSETKVQGSKITHLSYRIYSNGLSKFVSPRKEDYYWIGLNPLKCSSRDTKCNFQSDYDALNSGFISITPLKIDMTNYDDLDFFKEYITQ